MSDTGPPDGTYHSRAHSDPAPLQQNQHSHNPTTQQSQYPVQHAGTNSQNSHVFGHSVPDVAHPADLGYPGYHDNFGYHGYHRYPSHPFPGRYNTMPFYPPQRFASAHHTASAGHQNQSYQGGRNNNYRHEHQRSRDNRQAPGYFNKRNGYERQGARPKQYSAKKETRQNNRDCDAQSSEPRHDNKSEHNGASGSEPGNTEKTNGSDDNLTQMSGKSSKGRHIKSEKKLAKSTEEIDSVADGMTQRGGEPSSRFKGDKVKYATWHSKNRGKSDTNQNGHRKESNRSEGKNDRRKSDAGQKSQRQERRQLEGKTRDKQVKDANRQGARPRQRSLSWERKNRSRSKSGDRPATTVAASESNRNSDDVKTEQINDDNEKDATSTRTETGLQGRDDPPQRKAKEKPWKKYKDRENMKSPDSNKFSKNEGKRSRSLKCWSTSQSSRSSSYESLSGGKKNNFKMKETSNESQTGSMIEALSNGTYECMVCCDVIKCESAVWSCQSCYTVFHLHCIRKWARSPVATLTVESANGWRCPACQNVCTKAPTAYRCFCGKVREPAWQRTETPHSCGEVCRKRRSNTSCPHQCNILCHPGPCPTCPVTVTKMCACEKTNKAVRCGTNVEVHCDLICAKKTELWDT